MSSETSSITPRPGDFVWHELRTTDARAAEDFYTHVVGWTARPFGDGTGAPYTILEVDDMGTAGLMQITSDMAASGMRPSWAGFVGVDDVDQAAKNLQDAGGTCVCPPMDIPTVGRFAPVADPQGAAFLLFKGSLDTPPARPAFGAPGTVGWNELSADDGPSAWDFYSKLFGWSVSHDMPMGASGMYRIFSNGAQQIGAVMTRDPKMAPAPFWLFYFNVGGIDSAIERIREKNGVIHMGPHEVPGPMWIVIGTDPQGAMFAVVGHRETNA